jgi:hypothetical protein
MRAVLHSATMKLEGRRSLKCGRQRNGFILGLMAKGEALHVHKEQGLPCHMRGLITADLCNRRPIKQRGSSR